MIEKTGVPTDEMIKSIFPSIERINEGPTAIIECYQNIPCNPCETSCKFGAIDLRGDINNRPEMKADNCVGCGICLTKCPGLAIIIADGSKYSDHVVVQIPYELYPVPSKGDIVMALDREGKELGKVETESVRTAESFDKTVILGFKVPREDLYKFRNIKMEVE